MHRKVESNCIQVGTKIISQIVLPEFPTLATSDVNNAAVTNYIWYTNLTICYSRVQLKRDGTWWRVGREVKGNWEWSG